MVNRAARHMKKRLKEKYAGGRTGWEWDSVYPNIQEAFMTIAQTQFSKYSTLDADRPIQDLWQPEWTVDVGQEITVGIAMDDGCYVVLSQLQTGQWKPMTHIPVEAAKMLGRLAGG